MNIIWLATAVIMRKQQISYLLDVNPLAALMMDIEIDKKVNRLRDNPEIGRIGRVQGTRELVIQRTPYILSYRIKNQQIEVICLLHGAQKG